MKVAQRMHEAVRLLAAENRASSLGGRLTVTIGIGIGDAEPGSNPITLINVADQALYVAKQRGKNTTSTQHLTQKCTNVQAVDLVGVNWDSSHRKSLR
jgi:PleD family two-component response regulator